MLHLFNIVRVALRLKFIHRGDRSLDPIIPTTHPHGSISEPGNDLKTLRSIRFPFEVLFYYTYVETGFTNQ